jgi:zinc protease
MQNTIFDPAVVASERTVIISEREGAENYPSYYLREEVEALAFRAHPYRQPVIGWKEDLRAITRDDLYRHYRTFYHPSNAIVVLVGDIETTRMAEAMEAAFGAIPPGDDPPAMRVVEPEQSGERRVVVRRPGGATAQVLLGFHAPAASHPDLPALLVLDGILSGFKGVAPFDGGVGVRSSRLYRALVDRGLATEVSSGMTPSIDPALFRFGATARSGIDPAAIEAAILDEIARLQDEPPQDAELAKVRRQAQAQFVYLQDGALRRALALGTFATVDRPELLSSLAEGTARVTGDDVVRMAREYLNARRRTVGWYVPEQAHARDAAA